MNKTAIKNFAVWARNKLIADISYRAGLMGISESGIASALPQSTGTTEFYDIGTSEPYAISGDAVRQRRRLVELIERKEKEADYKTAYKYIIEEVAYTWFNRLIAIRFMEVNDYLPSHIRVLSSESGKMEPDLVTTPFDAGLEFTNEEEQKIINLKQENKLDELFRQLFIKQCNALNDILPELFEKTNDYTELLLNISFIDREGVVCRLLDDIQEEDFNVELGGQVEIIGWLYQYYISEKHDQIINISKGKIKKEDIPAATQLFTTDWVVRYIVDNSLGKYWIERNPESELVNKLEYYVRPKNSKIVYKGDKIDPTELTIFDPCMGSGHILVYAFDVLMDIYRESGYTDRDAAKSILEHNVFGLDIDKRAYQLAYFSLLMKARSYNRRILNYHIMPQICEIEESNTVKSFAVNGITNDDNQNIIGEYLVHIYKHAKEIGSLQSVKQAEYKSFLAYLDECEVKGQLNLFTLNWTQNILPIMKKLCQQAIVMSNKYCVVCTNPPYMNKMDGNLKKFVVDKYKPYSGDLFSVFMYRNFEYCKFGGYCGYMSPFVWMFIKTYENLRDYIIRNKSIITLVQMEYSAFEEATVPICSFVLKNGSADSKGMYFRLSNFKGGMDVQKKKVIEALRTEDCEYFYETEQLIYSKIPGMPIAYWVQEPFIVAFENGKKLGDISKPRQGMATTNNDKFLRLWYEVRNTNIGFNLKDIEETIGELKWFPYNKGGEYRKWYGNNEYVVNFKNKGEEVCAYIDATSSVNSKGRVINREHYFHESITWTMISSSKFGVRYSPQGFIFDIRGSSIFLNGEKLFYLLGLLASSVTWEILSFLSPTISFEVGTIAQIPIILEESKMKEVVSLVKENIQLSRTDWDSFETSWDFTIHPLIKKKSIRHAYQAWENECNARFALMKANEEKLNRIFIEIYGLENYLSPSVEEKDITVKKAELQREVKSLLSYAIGCMFGRYSLDNAGIICGGETFDKKNYTTYIPDEDNIIPITDEEYLEDDIISRLCSWLKKVYGENTVEDNLDYIAAALGNKGKSSREVIRNYFMNDFIKDHIKMYQKHPIYWMYDSGKQHGFKALVYMHRYNADTIGNLRIDYLHRMQRIYESETNRMQDMIDHSTNVREVATAVKRKEKLQKQLKECRQYDEKIGHLALSRIEIDLDDGVKVNYEKVQTASDGKKYQVLAKI